VGGDRLVESLQHAQRKPQAGQHPAFAVPVAELVEDGRGLLVGGDRLVESLQLAQRKPEVGQPCVPQLGERLVRGLWC